MTKPHPPRYVGLDISDRYAMRPRGSDVCVVTVEDGRLVAEWYTWPWPDTDDLANSLLNRVGEFRTLFIDGPQALARPGSKVRLSEALVHAPGRTPDHRPMGSKPFDGFIRSGLDLFDSLRSTGLTVGHASMVGVQEVFPGAIWKALASKGLAKKGSPEGLRQRAAILTALGVVNLPATATHDQLDAAVAAVLGAAVDGYVPRLEVARLGSEAFCDVASTTMREGVILSVVTSDVAFQALDRVLPLDRSTNRKPMTKLYNCPIDGCTKVFRNSRGGWDAHVASAKRHLDWLPGVTNREQRKKRFETQFPEFFTDVPSADDSYSIDDHRHRFAAWAAGRAASVSTCRFKVSDALAIIEAVGLEKFLRNPDALPAPSEIDAAHRAWRRATVVAARKACRIEGMTDGVAAKLINVYLKSGLVCGGHERNPRVAALHPPIDSVLLDELSRRNIGGRAVQWADARRHRWSKLTSKQYEDVIVAIRASLGDDVPLWKIESHWQGYR